MARASLRQKAAVKYREVDGDDDDEVKSTTSKGNSTGTKRKQEDDEGDDDDDDGGGGKKLSNTKAAPAVKKPKTAPKKATAKAQDDSMPLAERTAISGMKKAMYIGAHVSAAGGVQNAVTNAVHIGANAFALFLKSQRKWDNPPLAAEARVQFANQCRAHSYDAASHSLPHGSYLVNLAARDAAKADQAYRSFVDDLSRCDDLGIRLYNFHPGNTNGEPRGEAIARIAGQLNRAHGATRHVVAVLENMAGSGNVVGSSWEDLRDIIALVDDKSRVGVCIDTCHAFAAGYDLRSPKAFADTMSQFDSIVGRQYLKAVHLNDSKAPFASHRDLHANIGTGFLGLGAFHSLVNDDRFRGMPMVLETPIDSKDEKGKSVEDKQVWADEIKLLESLIGMDRDGDEFKRLDAELQARGADERKKIQAQADKKAAKGGKKK
ncbi:AP endonuclease 1 [Geosmithia morbida]|uniref:Apurinic-apyrimidinic endonuclease 1 n=1 Tax=Geosmithia morbida TaxID=1094350 RepID=A0A9P4YUH4_9HYPO|nr:AP endonuclease 1 [Geosmithia morbida]KAF4123338.1 AP endonuclease 1 [Geosmithia morbida]